MKMLYIYNKMSSNSVIPFLFCWSLSARLADNFWTMAFEIQVTVTIATVTVTGMEKYAKLMIYISKIYKLWKFVILYYVFNCVELK